MIAGILLTNTRILVKLAFYGEPFSPNHVIIARNMCVYMEDDKMNFF